MEIKFLNFTDSKFLSPFGGFNLADFDFGTTFMQYIFFLCFRDTMFTENMLAETVLQKFTVMISNFAEFRLFFSNFAVKVPKNSIPIRS